MKLRKLAAILLIGCIYLNASSCNTLRKLKPYEFIYGIHDGKVCSTKRASDWEDQENLFCKDLLDLEGWLVIHPKNLENKLTKGIRELLKQKAEN